MKSQLSKKLRINMNYIEFHLALTVELKQHTGLKKLYKDQVAVGSYSELCNSLLCLIGFFFHCSFSNSNIILSDRKAFAAKIYRWIKKIKCQVFYQMPKQTAKRTENSMLTDICSSRSELNA